MHAQEYFQHCRKIIAEGIKGLIDEKAKFHYARGYIDSLKFTSSITAEQGCSLYAEFVHPYMDFV